jgi:serine/threonine-protein kinase
MKTSDRLDHYRIEECVADTMTAYVFKAVDLRTGRSVALKVPKGEAKADVVFYDRFHREAAIGRELDHPGLPKVMPADGQTSVYFAMEWVEGESLGQLLQRHGKLPCDRATQIALAICQVLAYVHERGVVHRDLKPENVVLCADGSVKLIDFGIAAKAGARRLTFGKLSHVMGTADYISPEQVKGRRGDARSDLFALGVMLYEMLTGEMPFRGSNPLVVMNDRLLNDPVSPRKVNPDLPPELQLVLERLLQRDPKLRYATALELASDLRNPEQGSAPRNSTSKPRESLLHRLMLYSGLALLPATVYLMLLYVAQHE